MGIRHGVRKLLIGIAAAFIGAGAGTAFFGAGSAVTAFGAGTIGNLTITLENGKAEGEITEPIIRITPSSCQLTEVSWSKEVGDWKPGKIVYGYLTITANEGRVFEENYKSSKCSISGADFRSASAEEGNQSVLHVTIRYTPTIQLGMTEEAGWSDSNKTRAVWKKVPYATMYELRLYQNDIWVKTLEVTGTSVDISDYLESEGSYFYEVRAKGKNTQERKYLFTGEYVPSMDVVTIEQEQLGETEGTWRNYQAGRQYQGEDGTVPASQWKMIQGKWYYFDENGYAVTGWFQDKESDHWYYMNQQGEMQTGWMEQEQKWYYFNSNGQMAVGWLQTDPNEWYYMNPDGSMAENTVIDGQYPIGRDGKYLAAPENAS